MGMVDARCVRSSMIYGSETRHLLADVGLKFERADMQIIRWMCDVLMKDRRTSEELIMVVVFSLPQLLLEVVGCITRQYVLICNTNLPAKYIFMKSDVNNIYIYIYIYICVCVCVCAWTLYDIINPLHIF